MVLCLGEEKLKAQAGEATNQDVWWKHLQLLAPPNCPCIQADKDALNFYYLLKKNKKLKKSNFSKNKKGWYSEPFFPKTSEVEENFDGEPAAKKSKNSSPTNFNCENCPVLQVSISQLQEDLTLKTECSELNSPLCSER